MKLFTALCIAGLAAQPALAQSNSVHLVSLDSTRIGGLYDFQFFARDEAALREKFGGHDIEFRFEPVWEARRFPFVGNNYSMYGVYDRRIVVYDKTDKRVLAEYAMLLDTPPCNNLDDTHLSEHAGIFLDSEADPMVAEDSREKRQVVGSFTTDRDCYGDNRFIEGELGFAFSYGLEQWGGAARSDSAAIAYGDANTHIAFTNYPLQTVFPNTTPPLWQSMNNGPAAYELEFLPGGTDVITVSYGKLADVKVDTFTVSYLNVRVHNRISYERPASGGGTTTVGYTDEVPHSDVDVETLLSLPEAWPKAPAIPIGAFNLSAYAWVNGRYTDALIADRPQQAAGPASIENSRNKGIPVGTQGRYYLSAINDKGDTLDFAHVVIASGAELALDFSNKRGRKAAPPQWTKKGTQPTIDFKAGDKVAFSTFGGALGLPLPGASVVVHIDASTAVEETPEAHAGNVAVMPNPAGDRTSIRYKLEQPSYVTLTVVDELGRTVATLVDEHQQAGNYAPALDASGLKNGCYFYRLRTGDAVTSGKLVVLR